MTDFEFTMAFMAVLLGLAVAELMSRVADTIGARKRLRVGWLTPLLALTMFMIATQVWVNLWYGRESVTVDGGLMFVSALNGAAFYLAAALVFPRNVADQASLDDHYWGHKRYVAAILAATAMITEGMAYFTGLRDGPPSIRVALAYAFYFAPLLTLLFSRSGRLDIVAMLVLIAQYLAFKLA